MQIFSKLQRNSINYIFIIFFACLVNFFNSSFVYFPLLLGIFFLCFDIVSVFIFLILFSILHQYNLFFIVVFYLFFRFFLIKRIYSYFDKQYLDVILIFIVYSIFFIFLFYKNHNFNFDVIYSLYNYAFDIFLFRIFKCVIKL